MSVVRVNGEALDWGSIIIKLDGNVQFGLTAISYNEKLTRAVGRGSSTQHRAPTRRSGGIYEVTDVKITGYSDEIQSLLQALADRVDGVNYGAYEFPITVTQNELDIDSRIDVLNRCAITGINASYTNDENLNVEELDVSCMFVERNGLTLFNSRGILP